MDDLNKYIEKRKKRDPEFKDGFDEGYLDLKSKIVLENIDYKKFLEEK